MSRRGLSSRVGVSKFFALGAPNLRSMSSPLSLVVGVLALSLVGPLGCSSSDSSESEDEESAAEDLSKTKTFTELDEGKTVKVKLGQSFTIALKDKAASTGYTWMLKSVDKTLGEPKVDYTPPADPEHNLGANGRAKFTWSTKSPRDLTGAHKISLKLQRPWAENAPPADTYDITVVLKP